MSIVITSYSIHYTKLYDELLPKIIEAKPEIPVIMISGLNQVEVAVECVKAGAFDYFVKASEQERLLVITSYSIHYTKLYEAPASVRGSSAPRSRRACSSSSLTRSSRPSSSTISVATSVPLRRCLV